MPTPTRPVDDAEIATDWGQAVHDYTFAPSGFEAVGNDVTVTTTVTQLTIDGATNDPGGYLDLGADSATIPTNGAGLYLVLLRADSDTGVDGDGVRVYIRRNGGEIARGYEDSETGQTIIISVTTVAAFVAGDIITYHARKRGTGANPHVNISRAFLIRLGNEIGA